MHVLVCLAVFLPSVPVPCFVLQQRVAYAGHAQLALEHPALLCPCPSTAYAHSCACAVKIFISNLRASFVCATCVELKLSELTWNAHSELQCLLLGSGAGQRMAMISDRSCLVFGGRDEEEDMVQDTWILDCLRTAGDTEGLASLEVSAGAAAASVSRTAGSLAP